MINLWSVPAVKQTADSDSNSDGSVKLSIPPEAYCQKAAPETLNSSEAYRQKVPLKILQKISEKKLRQNPQKKTATVTALLSDPFLKLLLNTLEHMISALKT